MPRRVDASPRGAWPERCLDEPTAGPLRAAMPRIAFLAAKRNTPLVFTSSVASHSASVQILDQLRR